MIVLGRNAEKVAAEQARYSFTGEQPGRIRFVFHGEPPVSGGSGIITMEETINIL